MFFFTEINNRQVFSRNFHLFWTWTSLLHHSFSKDRTILFQFWSLWYPLNVSFHAAEMMVHLALACYANTLSYPGTETSLVLSAELPVSLWSVLCVLDHNVLKLHAWTELNFWKETLNLSTPMYFPPFSPSSSSFLRSAVGCRAVMAAVAD